MDKGPKDLPFQLLGLLIRVLGPAVLDGDRDQPLAVGARQQCGLSVGSAVGGHIEEFSAARTLDSQINLQRDIRSFAVSPKSGLSKESPLKPVARLIKRDRRPFSAIDKGGERIVPNVRRAAHFKNTLYEYS